MQFNYDKRKHKLTVFDKEGFEKYVSAFEFTYSNPSETINSLSGAPMAFGMTTPERTGTITISDEGLRILNNYAKQKLAGGSGTVADLIGYNASSFNSDIVVTMYLFEENKFDTFTLKGVSIDSFSIGFQSDTAVYERELPFKYMALETEYEPTGL